MKAATPFQPCNSVPLDRILNSAVIVNWDSLALGSAMAAVRIEYRTGGEGSVETLKLWACRNEYWSLVCDCSPRFAWSDGPRFANGYHSRSLGRLLQSILLNQNLFIADCGPHASGNIEIAVPTTQQITDATSQVSEAFR